MKIIIIELIFLITCLLKLMVNATIDNEIFDQDDDFSIKYEQDWFHDAQLAQIKQVAGIAAHPLQDVISIFHRHDVIWDANSFDLSDKYQHISKGPIPFDTVVQLNRSTGVVLNSWGSHIFFMPHGISFDWQGNVWLTDVALHQVMMFDRNDIRQPKLILGERFENGNDAKHFCKPTDVQVSRTGLVYISDGYCNSRIVIFTKAGQYVKSIGEDDQLFVPHSLTLLETQNLLCVADREKHRIICYDAGLSEMSTLGRKRKEINLQLGAIYAIDHLDSQLVGVAKSSETGLACAFILDKNFEKPLKTWNNPQSPFQMPHDITVDRWNSLYISEIDVHTLKKVLKFEIKKRNEIRHPSTGSALNISQMLWSPDQHDLNRRGHKRLPFLTKLSIFLFAFILTCLIGWIYIYRFNRRQKHDLTVAFKQLFTTPKDSGFNRLALDEELNEHLMDDNSDDSEVEEFSSKNYTHKLSS